MLQCLLTSYCFDIKSSLVGILFDTFFEVLINFIKNKKKLLNNVEKTGTFTVSMSNKFLLFT